MAMLPRKLAQKSSAELFCDKFAALFEIRDLIGFTSVTYLPFGISLSAPKKQTMRETMMSKQIFSAKSLFALSAASLALAMPSLALAQDAAQDEADTEQSADQGDIIVTATRRSEALSDIALAVSAVTGDTLANSGASDIRQLNQLSPSLLVSSTSSEAQGGGARIRGIGTVGDNPGLESSVATFVDGVYRNRAGVGLSELGAIERIEVLRGPQGTLFGRNASAGLIHVITAKPSLSGFSGSVEGTYGNYDALRFVGGINAPLSETIAARLDGVYSKRDGFIRDVISGRDLNNRDRWLLRGQLLIEPSDTLKINLSADYADRNEECCAAVFLPSRNVTTSTPGVAGGTLTFSPNSIVGLERALGAQITDNPARRVTSLTPGVGYRGDVKDWGMSGEVNYEFGNATLTSITAYRDWGYVRGQDADFNNLDILKRLDNGGSRQGFKTFTQELRLQGEAFDDKLDWLVGGYFANEKLLWQDNLTYGAQYGRYATCQIAGALGALNPANTACLSTTGRAGLTAGLSPLGALGAPFVAALDRIDTIIGGGLNDRYNQTSRNWALFTHNSYDFTDRLSLTLGLRYTNERKSLRGTITGNTIGAGVCGANAAALTPIRDNTALPGSARSLAASLISLSCVINPITNASIQDVKKEDEFTGTAVLSFKPVDGLLTYASYSRGYKAGGFNLDRAALNPAAPNPQTLQFSPEIVKAYELGAKYNGPGFDLNVAAFHQSFSGFQLNTFNGVNFIVTNLNNCSTSLNGANVDNSNVTGACTAKTEAGVTSKGVEIEAYLRPAPNFAVNMGLTYADTKYKRDLVGTGGAALPAALFQLPGSRLSNSSQIVATSSLSWTPEIGSSGLSALFYTDMRVQSDLNTGSDLDREKLQDGVAIVNARIGLRGAEQKWAVELFAQNIFDKTYSQVAFDAPLQGGNTIATVANGFRDAFGNPIASVNQLYGAFLAEPRTYGVTLRYKF
jgi:iron complex outermembrane recepter protein